MRKIPWKASFKVAGCAWATPASSRPRIAMDFADMMWGTPYSLFSGGELLAALGQFVLYLEGQGLADLVADQANDHDHKKDGGKDADGEAYAAQGAGGLHGVGVIAVAGKQPAGALRGIR